MKRLLLVLGILFSALISYSFELKDKKIVDKFGNSISATEYKKIVITDPGTIEILYKINGEKAIVAIGKTMRSKIYPEEKVDKLEVVGDIVNLNIEKMVEYKPDLIIISSMMTKNMDKLKKLGFNVIVASTTKLEDIITKIEALGVISGEEKNAEVLKENSLKKLKEIKEKANKFSNLKGTIIFSTSPLTSFSVDSLPGNVLKHLGVKNLAEGILGNRPILSPEYILKENPDFIAGAMSLDTKEQIMKASNVIAMTKAGKNNNIFILDSAVILRGSYRIFDEMEKLGEKLEEISRQK